MKPESPDPVLAALSELEAPAPRVARDALVRGRCHAAMRAASRAPAEPAHAAWRAIDRLLPVAVVVYAVAVVVEGLRTIGVL
jgi:hypothetical protein